MKRMKINFAMLAMLVGATAAFAFKAPSPTPLANSLWKFNGGDATVASNYSATTGVPCAGSDAICEISAPADPGNSNQPAIDTGLQSRIEDMDTSNHDVFLKSN